MPLLALDQLAHSLASPCCRAVLTELRCSECGRAYPMVGRWPVLVDETRSVLSLDQFVGSGALSVVDRRRSPVQSFVKRLLSSGGSITRRNIRRLLEILPPESLVLVVGGGAVGKGAEDLYTAPVALAAFDIYASDKVQIIGDAHHIPLVDGSVDAVVVQAVLEHVLDPHAVVAEIHRVLRADGLVYAETPFLQNVHEGAYDFTRFTESGHRWLFRSFDQLESGPFGGPFGQLVWSLAYLGWAVTGRRAAGRAVRALFSPVALLDRFVSRDHRSDSATGIYFLGRRSEQSMTPNDAIAAYRGAQTGN